MALAAEPRAARPADAPPAAPVRLDGLTSMRWFAALCVFGVHFDAIAGVLHGLDTHVLVSTGAAVTDAASTGVSFFFVLSGFVLTWSQLRRARPKPTGPFLRDRVARIVPNHLATSALVLVLLGGVAKLVSVPAVFLVQAWLPRQRFFFALNVPSWTLSVEMFFYLCFPLILGRAVRLTQTQRRAAIAILASVTIAIGALPVPHYWPYIFPPARLPEFVIGILLALEIDAGHWRRIPVVPTCALLLVVMATEQHLPVGFSFAAATLIPVILVIAATAGSDLTGRNHALHARWLVRLGEWSFAFYIVHNLVLLKFARMGDPYHWPHGSTFLVAGGLLLLCIAAAAALCYVVERPAQAWLSGASGANRGGRFS